MIIKGRGGGEHSRQNSLDGETVADCLRERDAVNIKNGGGRYVTSVIFPKSARVRRIAL